MTDEYAETLVIRDPNYRPGDAFASEPAPVTKDAEVEPEKTESSQTAYPDFDDTSWLT